MKLIMTGLGFLGSIISNIMDSPTPKVAIDTRSFYDLKILSLDKKTTLKMEDFKGKKVLIVNVASECGYTGQYEDLQKLHEKYKDKLVLIGVPCNQFGGQEPGTAADIQSFCKKNYGVTFTLTEKVSVKGGEQHPLYQWLTMKSLNGKDDYTVKWNFNKFLVSETGQLIGYYGSGVKPMSEELIKAIEN